MSTGQALGYVVGAVVGYFTGGTSYVLTGAALGGTVGAALDPPKGPDIVGPRLSDLTFQTSTYGVPIPHGYGKWATYGNVFWLEGGQYREVVRKKKTGGKGGSSQSTKTYTYFATFALGLAMCKAAPIAGVRRIWISGKLFYDAGSSDQETIAASNEAAESFAVYYGTDDQLPDPRFEADVGAANASGYPGLAYIVFYDLPLADYGNSLAGAQIKVEVICAGSVERGQTVLLMHMDSAGFPDEVEHTVSVAGDTELVLRNGPFGNVAGFYNPYSAGSANYIRVDGSPDFHLGTDDFTIEFRSAGDGFALIYGGSSLNTQRAFRIFLSRSSGRIEATWYGASGSQTLLSLGSTIDFAQVNHIAIARRGGVERHFCNGVKVAEYSNTIDIRTPVVQFPHLYIGGGESAGLIGHTGWMDEIRIVTGMAVYWDDFVPLPVPFDVWGLATITSETAVLGDIVQAECLQSPLLALDDLDVSDLTQEVIGYRVAQTGSIRGAIEPLASIWPFDVVLAGYKIRFVPRGQSSLRTIAVDDLDARSDGDAPGVSLVVTREMDTQLPAQVRLTYTDLDREYDDNVQLSPERRSAQSASVVDVEAAVVLSADDAANAVEVLHSLYWMERTDFAFRLMPEHADLECADVITLADSARGESYEVRLVSLNALPDGRIECGGKPNNVSTYQPAAEGASGAQQPPTLGVAGPSAAAILDVPVLIPDQDTPSMLAAMTGFTAGWPGGVLFRSGDGGQTWSELQGWADPCTMGYARNAIGAQSTTALDISSVLRVDMYGGELESVSYLAMLNGANYFAYGADGRWEIVAARTCTLEADGSYSVRDMLRGRFGTEHNIGNHVEGDALILLTDPDVAFIVLDSLQIGLPRIYRAVTVNKDIDSASDISQTYQAVNLTPLSPVYAKGARNRATDDWEISWIRRTRVGGEWRDLVDASLGEATEAYEVDIYDGPTVVRTLSATTPAATYTNAQQVADFGAVQDSITLAIYQMSAAVGRGYPLNATLVEPPLLFNPMQLAPYQYLDSTIVASVTTVSGAVSQWSDVSGNARHVTQGTAGKRPAYVAGVINGYPVIRFDGTDDELTRAATMPNVFSIFMVAKHRDLTEGDIGLVSQNSGTAQPGRVIAFIERDTGTLQASLQVGTSATKTGTRTGDFNLYAYTRDSTAAGIRFNGEAAAGAVNSNAVESVTYRIGQDGGSLYTQADAVAVLLFNRVLTTTEIEKLEGYYAHLLALTHLLDVSHPYKTTPPEA